MENELPGVGHNRPPEPEALRDQLTQRHDATLKRFAELTASFQATPSELKTDAEAEPAQDLYKMMRALIADSEAQRRIEKRPFEQLAGEVDAFFMKPSEALVGLARQLRERITTFQNWKKTKAQLEKQAKADAQRKEAERLAEEAAAQEARRMEAERQAALEAARAEDARRQKEVEERRAAKARARLRRLEAVRKYLDVRARRAQLAEALRDAQERRVQELQAIAKREADEAKKAAAGLRRDEKRATVAAADQVDVVRDAHKQAEMSLSAGMRADSQADRMSRQARGSSADLSRTRSDLGSVGSLGGRWTYEIENMDAIPLERLRGFLHEEAIRAAVYRAMMDGIRDIPGVRYERVEEAVIR